MSWKNIKKIGRTTGLPIVHASAHHNHEVLAVDIDGNTYWINRQTQPWTVELSEGAYSSSTTAALIKGQEHAPNPEWKAELDRRIAEVTQAVAP